MKVRHRWIVADHIVQDRAAALLDSLVQLIRIVAAVCAVVISVKVSLCEESSRTSDELRFSADVLRWCPE